MSSLRFLCLASMFFACVGRDGDVSVVAVADVPSLADAVLSVDALRLEPCRRGAEPVDVGVSQTIDLLTPVPAAFRMPGGRWCGASLLVAASDGPSLVLSGTLSDGTPFDVAAAPALVAVEQEISVDGEEWVWVVDTSRLLAPLVDGSVPPQVAEDDAGARVIEAGLLDASWLGTVPQARDDVWIDLWPFPDVAFALGTGDVDLDVNVGCGQGTRSPDPTDDAPADDDPADDPTDETPTDEMPTDETPTDETPTDETPTDETPTDETPTDETSTDDGGGDGLCGACGGCFAETTGIDCGCDAFGCDASGRPRGLVGPMWLLVVAALRRRPRSPG